MKWPFENDSSGVVKKLARRTLTSDRKSARFLILTIAAAMAMVFGIALVSAGLAEEAKDPYRAQAQVSVLAPSETQLAALHSAEEIEWVGEYAALGYSYQEGAELFVIYADENYLTKQSPLSYTGTLPQAADEVMLEQDYLTREGIDAAPGDEVALDLTGLGDVATYRLSGIAESDASERSSYTVYVSKPLAQHIAEQTMAGQWQMTAYTRLATDEISADALTAFAQNVMTPLGVDSRQIFLTDYFAAMAGALGGGLHLSIPLLALVTGGLAGIIIYGVFYTMIAKKVQTLGQLRTIGMTTKQVRRMMRRNGRLLAWKGIVLGLVLGLIVGVVVSPSGFRVHTALLYAIASALFIRLAVACAMWRPVRIAAKTSPVEGARYQSTQQRRKKTRRHHHTLTPARLARINLSRHLAKTVFTMVALAASGVLFLTLATVADSTSAEKQARFEYFPYGDIEINLQHLARSTFDANGEYNYGTRLQVEDNPLSDPALIDELMAIPGVEAVTPHKGLYAGISIQLSAMDILGRSETVPLIDRNDFEHIASLLSPTVDYDVLCQENAVLINDDYGKAGDTVTIEVRGKDGEPYSYEAPVVASYDAAALMEAYPLVPGLPTFLMTTDTATALTGVRDYTGMLTIDCAEGAYESVREQVMQLADASDEVDENDISQTIANIETRNESTMRNLRIVAMILFLFGSISIANTLVVDMHNRRRDFALLGAVGATQKQLRQMLAWEMGVLIGGAGGLSVLGAVVASAVSLHHIEATHHCVQLALPWAAFVSFLVLLLVIAVMLTVYSGKQLARRSALLDLRDE